jgi:hypothetical protein
MADLRKGRGLCLTQELLLRTGSATFFYNGTKKPPGMIIALYIIRYQTYSHKGGPIVPGKAEAKYELAENHSAL